MAFFFYLRHLCHDCSYLAALAIVELGGNELSDFGNRWCKVPKEIRGRPDLDSLVEMLSEQTKKSFVLAKDMEYVDGLSIKHEDQTHPWLLAQIQKLIQWHKERLLQRQFENSKGGPHMTLLGDARQCNGHTVSASAT